MAWLAGGFGLLATLMSTIGLYGVISYMTVRRRQEIAIRRALGARRSTIVSLILSETALTLAVGIPLGAAASAAAVRGAGGLLWPVAARSADALAFGGAACCRRRRCERDSCRPGDASRSDGRTQNRVASQTRPLRYNPRVDNHGRPADSRHLRYRALDGGLRARETRRPDAVFRDPFAKALAGERGEQIAKSIGFGEENDWPFVARTYLFDRVIKAQVAAGADLVLDLAAGLDTRPYRMELQASLRWVEVDLPEILDYKEKRSSATRRRCVRWSACGSTCRTATRGAASSRGWGVARLTCSSSPKD